MTNPIGVPRPKVRKETVPRKQWLDLVNVFDASRRIFSAIIVIPEAIFMGTFNFLAWLCHPTRLFFAAFAALAALLMTMCADLESAPESTAYGVVSDRVPDSQHPRVVVDITDLNGVNLPRRVLVRVDSLREAYAFDEGEDIILIVKSPRWSKPYADRIIKSAAAGIGGAPTPGISPP